MKVHCPADEMLDRASCCIYNKDRDHLKGNSGFSTSWAQMKEHDGLSFSPCKPPQSVDFSKVGNMQFFFKNLTHILTRTQGRNFEDLFLVKIASKGTSFKEPSPESKVEF